VGGTRLVADRRRRLPWARPLLKAVIGIGAPLLLLVLFIQSQTPRPDPAPPPVALEDPSDAEAAVQLVGSPDGTWTLDPAGGSFLGYRIVEDYPRLTDPIEAAGRTTAVEATLEVGDRRIVAAEVRGDLRALDSGDDRRDQATRARYLESREHPWATFELTEPLRLPEDPSEPFSATARGRLTIRDVTREVSIPLQARWAGEQAQVIGSVAIRLSDFDVAAPDIPGFVTVDDAAVVELDLRFVRS
jgi:polyisoprenoid-binding protein YceI